MRDTIENCCEGLSLVALMAGLFSWLTILEAFTR